MLTDRQTDKKMYLFPIQQQLSYDGDLSPNFNSNLAMMVIYLPVKFDFDWTKHFRVRVRKLK